jgi:hypothetical protein
MSIHIHVHIHLHRTRVRALNSAFDCILGSSTFLVIFSTCPTGLFFVFSRSCSPPAEGSSIARSCQLVCPSSRYRANTKVAWGIRGFRYSWSPAGMITSPAGHHTHALDLLSTFARTAAGSRARSRGRRSVCIQKERAFNALRGGRSSGALIHRMYACSDRQPFSRA